MELLWVDLSYLSIRDRCETRVHHLIRLFSNRILSRVLIIGKAFACEVLKRKLVIARGVFTWAKLRLPLFRSASVGELFTIFTKLQRYFSMFATCLLEGKFSKE